jgi:hypothetical protein
MMKTLSAAGSNPAGPNQPRRLMNTSAADIGGESFEQYSSRALPSCCPKNSAAPNR